MKKTSPDLQARLQQAAAQALEEVAARGVLEISLSADDIKRIYALAEKSKKPVSFLVHEWVIECMAAEEKKGFEQTA